MAPKPPFVEIALAKDEALFSSCDSRLLLLAPELKPELTIDITEGPGLMLDFVVGCQETGMGGTEVKA
eukprot:10736277-Alexandrium_andersonii.AAC.1